MKPQRIILVRHGESVGNADPTHYETIPDYQVELSDLGREHAEQAGSEIRSIVGNEKIFAYNSPWTRARQTLEHIACVLGKEKIVKTHEDPRIREQEFGHLRSLEQARKTQRERIKFGTFHYRIPNGESGADVYDRVTTFMDTLHRDFAKADYPNNTLIVTHGMTLRVFLMRWFHWSYEDFEALRNPKNGQVVVMERNDNNDKYKLISELAKRYI